LAAVTALKDAQANASPPLVFQLLIVPLLDNAATLDSIGRRAECGAPGLILERLLYFQRCYLPRPEDGNCWEASPIRISLENLRKWPLARAYIAVAEVDPLCYEGLKYKRMLERAGKAPTVNRIERASHQVMGLAGVTKKSRELHLQLISYMAKQFGEPLEGAQP
jgi:acetyl esterase/lipase